MQNIQMEVQELRNTWQEEMQQNHSAILQEIRTQNSGTLPDINPSANVNTDMTTVTNSITFPENNQPVASTSQVKIEDIAPSRQNNPSRITRGNIREIEASLDAYYTSSRGENPIVIEADEMLNTSELPQTVDASTQTDPTDPLSP
jgi:hypothetical protein